MALLALVRHLPIVLALIFFSQFAQASACGESTGTQFLHRVPNRELFVAEIFQHNNDAAGYDNWFGSFEFFDKKGESLGALSSGFEDSTQEPPPSHVRTEGFCNSKVLDLFPKSKANIEKVCQAVSIPLIPNQATKVVQSNGENHVRNFLKEIRSELGLQEVKKEKDHCGLSIKVTASSFYGEVPRSWGQLQILKQDSATSSKLSVVRLPIPPGTLWYLELIGCQNGEEGLLLVALERQTTSPCLGDARQVARAFLLPDQAIEAARLNVKGLREFKDRNYVQSIATFKLALEKDPKNELAQYNLVSALSVAAGSAVERQAQLEKYLALILANAKASIAAGEKSERETDLQLFKKSVREKILKDSDLKSWPRTEREKFLKSLGW